MQTSLLNRIEPIRARHRLALPVLPIVMSRMRVDADVVICGTSGWAQGIRTEGRKVIYFYALTRWLYERNAYLKGAGLGRRIAATTMAPLLGRWDRRTMATGDRFVTEGTVMQRRLAEIYGLHADIIPLPNTLDVRAPRRAVPGLSDGFYLCASRLMPYKNVDVLIEAFAGLPGRNLVVAGDGPLLTSLRLAAPPNVRFLGRCDDDELRWLYAQCRAVITAAIEPFGLTPVEGAAFGKPTVALRDGGFVDTVLDGITGVLFDEPDPIAVRRAVDQFEQLALDEARILDHSRQYDEPTFVDRIRALIAEEVARA
jgi:glycosyltransferase involved in cell wall biosynthesis